MIKRQAIYHILVCIEKNNVKETVRDIKVLTFIIHILYIYTGIYIKIYVTVLVLQTAARS